MMGGRAEERRPSCVSLNTLHVNRPFRQLEVSLTLQWEQVFYHRHGILRSSHAIISKMVAAGFIWGCIVGILLAFRSAGSLRLNEPRILLPYSYGLPTNFTLEVDGNYCFEWFSNNPLYVAITPVYNSQGCSKSAIVSSIYHSHKRHTIRVTASTIIDSNLTEIHCDVILENLRSIEIKSLVEKLFVGEPPEKIRLVGTDEFGHIFSSLNGFQVEWNLSKEGETCSVAKFEKLIDSSYGSNKDLNALEVLEHYGSNVLLHAVEPGSCTISAKIQYKDQFLTSNQIRLEVEPSLRVFPSVQVALLRYAVVDIYVEKLHGGLPNGRVDSYALETGLENFSGKDYGVQQINLVSKDSMLPEIPLEINIVKPKLLEFQISGCSEFSNLVALKTYIITINLFDENSLEIFPSGNLRIAVKFSSKLFHVHSSTANGTYHVVQAVAPGKGKIEAELKGVELEDGSKVKDAEIKAVQNVNVYQRVEIFPPVVHLPSYSVEPLQNSPMYEIDLKAAGGSGHFVWSSSNRTAGKLIIPSDESTTVKLQIFKESNFVISAFDKSNLKNGAVSKIFIQAVTDIEVYPTVVEAEIGNTIILPVALLGKESDDSEIIQKFDDCFKIKPKVDIIEKHVVRYDSDPFIPGFGKGCLSLNLKCTSAGYSRINVAYNEFKTTTVVSCFKPLKPIHPVRVAVLPVGASKEIAFEGGPRRFPLFKEGHYTKLDASDPDIVKIQLVKDPIRYNKDLTVFLIKCKALGENTLKFTIGNERSATNAHPAKEETSIKIVCSKPSSVHLKLPKSTSKRETQLPDNVVKVPFYGEKKFSVDLFIKDDMGRKFSNVSSLKIEFDVSNKDLVTFESLGVTSYINAVEGYRKVSRNFKEFQMSGTAGKLKISAKVVGYLDDVLKKEEVPIPSDNFPEISTDIDLDLVSLRDINAGLYSSDSKDTCDGDSCKY